ncbi:MAG TPA: tRNA pseudouridine synthase A, partial [Ignavibacteriaceae bacterium]|nr:tRNA pseudouridine synthase A [Ignavibacteriaceae bacterium]
MRKSKSWIKGESKSKSWNKPESSRFQTKANKQKIFSRFKLILEYEGTRYSGWQRQQNARTVQGELIKACEKIFESGFIDLQGSGRTDSGVHAFSQVAHLDADSMLAPHIIMMKLNDLLPYDINILDLEKSNKNFHARHSAKSRIYLYQISRRRNAFEKNHVWWVKD